MNNMEIFKKFNTHFIVFCAGLVLSVISVFEGFNSSVSIPFSIGWFLIFIVFDIRKAVNFIAGENSMKYDSSKKIGKNIAVISMLATAIGMALVIVSLIDVLSIFDIFTFSIGLSLLLLSLNLRIK